MWQQKMLEFHVLLHGHHFRSNRSFIFGSIWPKVIFRIRMFSHLAVDDIEVLVGEELGQLIHVLRPLELPLIYYYSLLNLKKKYFHNTLEALSLRSLPTLNKPKDPEGSAQILRPYNQPDRLEQFALSQLCRRDSATPRSIHRPEDASYDLNRLRLHYATIDNNDRP